MKSNNKVENRLVIAGMFVLGLAIVDVIDSGTMPERALAEGQRLAKVECISNGVSQSPALFSSRYEGDDYLFSSYLTPGVSTFIAWQCGSYFGQYVFKMPHFYGRPKIAVVVMGKVPGPGVAPNEVTRVLNVNALTNAGFGMKEASFIIYVLKGAIPEEFNVQ